MNLPIVYRTVLLLACSNTFMTFAWYAHLRNWGDKKWYIAALLSWGLRCLNTLLQVPAKPHWLHHHEPVAIESDAGDHHARRVRAVRVFLHASTPQAGFSMGWSLPGWRCVLHVPWVTRPVRLGWKIPSALSKARNSMTAIAGPHQNIKTLRTRF